MLFYFCLFSPLVSCGIFLNASVLYCIDPAKLHTCDLQLLKNFTYYFRFPSKVCSKKVSHVETTTKWRYGCEIFGFFYSRSLKLREKYISFAHLILHSLYFFLREVFTFQFLNDKIHNYRISSYSFHQSPLYGRVTKKYDIYRNNNKKNLVTLAK